jgi:BASS family bile acid:Na+ symporter
MDTWLEPFAAIFTAAMMFSAGAATSGREIRLILADRDLLARAFIVNVVLVPALAAAVMYAFQLRGEFATGAMLAAICPGAPFGTFLAARTRANVALAMVLTCGLTIVSLVTAPVTSLLIFGPGKIVALPRGLGLLIVVLIVLLPVLSGQAVRRRSAVAAARLSRFAGLLTFAALLGANVAASGLRSRGVRLIGWRGSALILSLVAISIAVGWLFGRSPSTRTTLATSSGLRNVGLAFLFAEYSFPGTRVEVGVAAYSILMLLPNFAVALLSRQNSAAPVPE